MSKKENRISVIKFEKALGEENIAYIPLCGCEDTMIEIKRTIPFHDVVNFVEIVAESCVDTNAGIYTPQVLDFVTKRELLTTYANFTMPHNYEKQYDLIYRTDVVQLVIDNINQLQLQEILTSIDKKVKFMLDSINSVAAVNVLKLIDKIESMSSQSNLLFDSLQGIDLEGVLKNINELANMNEGDFVKAIQKNIEDQEE